MAKRGRPELYTEELGETICDMLADGTSLSEVCRLVGMPSTATVYSWISKNPDFSTKYTRAIVARGHYYGNKVSEVGEEVLKGRYDPAAARVAIDAFKWTAAKMASKNFGDKLELSGDPDRPVIIQKVERVIVDPSKV